MGDIIDALRELYRQTGDWIYREAADYAEELRVEVERKTAECTAFFEDGAKIRSSLSAMTERAEKAEALVRQLGLDFGFDAVELFSMEQVITHAKYLQAERARLLFDTEKAEGDRDMFKEAMDSANEASIVMSRKEGYVELESKILELAGELEKAEGALCAAIEAIRAACNSTHWSEFMRVHSPEGRDKRFAIDVPDYEKDCNEIHTVTVLLQSALSSSSPCRHESLAQERQVEIERLREESRDFPMQFGPPIPWALAESIYTGYAAVNGKDQTLVRLAERGGFSWGEVELMWRERSRFRGFREAVEGTELRRRAAIGK